MTFLLRARVKRQRTGLSTTTSYKAIAIIAILELTDKYQKSLLSSVTLLGTSPLQQSNRDRSAKKPNFAVAHKRGQCVDEIKAKKV